MCNTFAVYFQIFATFGYKKVKNSERNMCHSVMTLTAVPGRESLHLSFLVWGKE